MAYFSNRTINCLNLHTALAGLLEQAYIAFAPLYLYTRGFTVAEILAFIAVSILLRSPMRLLSLPFIRRFGLKSAVQVGMAGYALSFVVLSHVKGLDLWLLFYMLVYSIFNSMHWFAFHTWYSIAGEHAQRGRQVAMGYALTAMIAALVPLLSAVTIAREGFKDYFLLVFPLTALMLLNLSRCRNIAVPHVRWADGRSAIASLGVKIHLLESVAAYPLAIGWLFTLYLYIGTITPLGGIITFGIIAQIFYQLLVGSWVDSGRGPAVVNAAGSLRMAATLGCAFLPLSLPAIFSVQAVFGAGDVHHLATAPTAIYNSAKQSANTLLYWLFAEMAWDAGTFFGAGFASLLLWKGMGLRHVILISLPPMGSLWWLLHRYFSRHAYAPS